MFTTFGFSRSADAAATFARARAVGIGGRSGHNIFSLGGVRQLGDKMFEAFCLVCESPDQDDNQNRQTGHPHDNEYLRILEKCPWMLSKYPWMLERYPLMFKTQATNDNSHRPTIH